LNNLAAHEFGGLCSSRGQNKENLNNRRNLLSRIEDEMEPSGQVRFDDRGNAVWETGLNRRLEHPALTLADDQAPRNTLKTNGTGLKAGYNPYDSGMLPKPSHRRKKDLRALSRWIEQSKSLPDKNED
jgi:hypothetical protein